MEKLRGSFKRFSQNLNGKNMFSSQKVLQQSVNLRINEMVTRISKRVSKQDKERIDIMANKIND